MFGWPVFGWSVDIPDDRGRVDPGASRSGGWRIDLCLSGLNDEEVKTSNKSVVAVWISLDRVGRGNLGVRALLAHADVSKVDQAMLAKMLSSLIKGTPRRTAWRQRDGPALSGQQPYRVCGNTRT